MAAYAAEAGMPLDAMQVSEEEGALESINEAEEMPDFEDEGFMEEDGVPGTSPSKRSMQMSVDGTATPRYAPKTPRTVQRSAFKSVAGSAPPQKKKKKKARKSQIDISALTNEQIALAALQSNEILHLKLRKRYYAEGLSFIRHIESGMETIGKLLGSLNKAEVLESMEFFRVAHEYQIQGSEVSR